MREVRKECLKSLEIEMLEPYLYERLRIPGLQKGIKQRIMDICNIPEEQEVVGPERASRRCHYCDYKKNQQTRYFCK